MAMILKFFTSAFNAWLMKPIYQAVIVILVIAVIMLVIKQNKGKNAGK